MSNISLPDARQRFNAIAATFAAAPDAAAIRTGFAMLTPSETAAELIARADSELIDTLHGDHDSGPSATAPSLLDRWRRRAPSRAMFGCGGRSR